MSAKAAFFIIFSLFVFLFFSALSLIMFFIKSIAAPKKANIYIDVRKTRGPVGNRWKAIAQGGEEQGVRMLGNVTSQLAALYPRYIRLDHIYDYYDVVKRNTNGSLNFNWQQLDDTVCDIYRTGAKPFFSLGYMPPTISQDGSLISKPANWDEWSLLVQKTIERYSGTSTRLCGQVTGYWMTDIYYEVWNEPDLETFGKWSLYGGEKDYKTLYYYSVLGAEKAADVNRFLIGGPATTSLYRNWITKFLDYLQDNNLRIDFLSWHHYSPDPESYTSQMKQINSWLSSPQYQSYRYLPKVISEWGYDSNPNPIADSNIGAAYTVAAIRNFFHENLNLAFLFEAKDGPQPRWGILSYSGEEKPRYTALKFLNQLEGNEIFIDGEGTFVKALGSVKENSVNIILVNYDQKNNNTEAVPVTFDYLESGTYTMNTDYLDGRRITVSHINIPGGTLQRNIIMPPNTVVKVELVRE